MSMKNYRHDWSKRHGSLNLDEQLLATILSYKTKKDIKSVFDRLEYDSENNKFYTLGEEILNYITKNGDKNSIAYNLATIRKKLSDKQRWLIAYYFINM